MANQLSNQGLEINALAPSDIPTGASAKVLLYASGSGSDARLYVKAGADSQKLLGIDIDSLSALGSATVAQGDHVLVSDAGTEKKVTFSNFEDSIFGNVSGDVTVAAGGVATIAAGSVHHGMLAEDIISGQANLGGVGVADADEFLFSDDGTVKALTGANLYGWVFSKVSGDATVSSGGALTIANDAVEQAMIADDAVGADQLASNAVVNASVVDGSLNADKLDIDGSTDIGADLVDADLMLVDDGAGGTNRKSALSRVKKYIYSAMSGDATASDAGALTIAANAVEGSMLNTDVISAQTELASDGLAAADELMISDAGTLKKIGVDNLFKDGPGLLGAEEIAVANDHIMFLDGGASGDAKIESVADLMTAVAGDGLAASSGVLAVGVDDSSIETNSDALRVKALGVTNAMLAGSIANAKLSNSAITVGGTATSLGGTVTGAHLAAALNSDLGGNFTIGNQSSDTATFSGAVTVAGNLTVQGTTTTVDSTTINIVDKFTFEGTTEDAHETVFQATDPTADTTIKLPALAAGTYFVPMLADTATAASSAVTAAEFALLDGGSSVGTTALASGDGFLHNDGGTMKQTSVDKIADLFAGAGLAASSGVLSVDIDELSALGGAGLHQTQDHFMFSDNGTEKKITFSNLQDAVFADVSGDATIAAGGALTIASQAVENSMLADDAVGADELAANAVVNASVVDGALKADKLDLDGSTDIGAALADADLIIVDDGAGGTNRVAAMSRVMTYIESGLDALSNNLSMGDNNITNVGSIALDSIAADNVEMDITLTDNQAAALEIKEGSTAYLTFNTSDGAEGIAAGKSILMASNNRVYFEDSTNYDQYIGSAGSGATEIGSSGGLLFNAASNVFYSSTTEKPTVTIKNTNNDATGGALVFQKDGASAADNDVLGSMSWAGENDNASPEAITYASISAKSKDVSDGSEDGSMHFVAMIGGAETTWADFNSTTASTLTLGSSIDVKAQTFITYSDRTLKTNIQKMDNCLEKVMALQPTTYDKVASGRSEIGFIAQDVAKVVPEICALDANGEGRGIDYSRMSTLLVGALKAQQDQIAQLKDMVAKLQK